MPEFKLTYFDGRARAEVSRIMLTCAGKKFTDNRMQKEDWPAYKPKTPLGSMPVLDIEMICGRKTQLCQSMSIARYVARETGFAGKDSLQQAQVDMISTSIDEIMSGIVAIFVEKDEKKKLEMDMKHKETFLPNVLRFLEKCLEKNSCCGGFFVGKSVTLADFIAWHVLEYIVSESEAALDTYPKLKANRQVVSKLPKFAEYQKNRPKTAF